MSKKVKARVVTDGVKGFFKRAGEHARKLDRGQKLDSEVVISFDDGNEMVKVLSKEDLRLLRTKNSPTSALMRRLRRVRSAGPYTRDEMNER